MNATHDGKPVPGMSYTDYSVELGAGNDLPELDEHLPGAKAGDTVNFEARIRDNPVQVEVAVKQVQEKVLPEVSDSGHRRRPSFRLWRSFAKTSRRD